SIAGTDIDAEAIDRARRNQARAGLPEAAIDWQVCDAARLQPPFSEPGIVVSNPPYGERLDAQIDDGSPDSEHEAAMHAIGANLRAHWWGWQVWLLTTDPALPRQLGMKENRRTPLFNGALE